MSTLDVLVMEKEFDSRTLIRNFWLTIPSGDVIGLLGPSGTGKTTLLRIIAGLDREFSGSVRHRTREGLALDRPARVGFVFQDHRLLPWLKVRENVAIAVAGAPDRLHVAEQWIRRVGLESRADAWPKVLSGGELSRVSIARALASAPEILILDEPFTGLDPVVKARVMEDLAAIVLDEGITTIFVSHSVEEAVLFCDDVLVLEGGPLRVRERFRVPESRPRGTISMPLAECVADVHRALATLSHGPRAAPALQSRLRSEP